MILAWVLWVTPTDGLPISPVSKPFSVKIECDLREAIELGKYEVASKYAHPINFPTPMFCKSGAKVDIHLLRPDPKSDDWVAQQMTNEGYRPATLREILALGISHPDLQRQFHIVALGSSILGPDGLPIVPFIGADEKRRCLNFASYARKWDSQWRFAAIRFRK